jgi:hypothetical protein
MSGMVGNPHGICRPGGNWRRKQEEKKIKLKIRKGGLGVRE